MGRRDKSTGFTLLEAVVAMTLFATTALGLYSWINSMLIGTARFNGIAVETTDLGNAVDYLSMINPMQEPDGSRKLGVTSLSWESELVEPVRPGRLVRGFEFGLYDVTARLSRPGYPEQVLSLRQVGYRRMQANDSNIGI